MVVGTTFLEALWVVMFAGLWIGVVAVVIMSDRQLQANRPLRRGEGRLDALHRRVPAPGGARLHDRAAGGPIGRRKLGLAPARRAMLPR